MFGISSSFYFFKKCSSVLQYFRVLLEYYFSVLRSIKKAKMPILNTPEYPGVFTKYSSSTRGFQYSTPRVEYIVNTPVLYSSTDSQYSCLPLTITYRKDKDYIILHYTNILFSHMILTSTGSNNNNLRGTTV